MKRLQWDFDAWDDYLFWQTQDRKILKRINQLLKDISRSPFEGIGKPDDFEKAMTVSVNHDGDSDSTGAVTGNILGAALGYDAIPQKYTDHLELKDVILEIANDLYNDCQITADGAEDALWESEYMDMTYGKK